MAQAYATRVRFFTRTPSDSSIGYVQSEQRIKEDGSDIPGQEEDRLWYCHRPVTHAAMQAALMYAGFGRVQDVVASGPAILTAQDYKDASLLAQAGSKIYRREAMQRDRVNGVLCNILGCNIKQYTIRARK